MAYLGEYLGTHSISRRITHRYSFHESVLVDLPGTAVDVACVTPAPTWPGQGRQAGARACCMARQPGASTGRYREISGDAVEMTAEMTAKMQSRYGRDLAEISGDLPRSRRDAPAGARTRCDPDAQEVPIPA